MQLSAATGVNRRSLLCLSGNGMWLHGAGNNDLLRRTSGCCETHLLFWHSGRSAGIPNTLLTYAMTYASDEDIETLKKYFSDDEFKAALDDPAPGIFDQSSWTKWNQRYGRTPIPPLPKRRPQFLISFLPNPEAVIYPQSTGRGTTSSRLPSQRGDRKDRMPSWANRALPLCLLWLSVSQRCRAICPPFPLCLSLVPSFASAAFLVYM